MKGCHSTPRTDLVRDEDGTLTGTYATEGVVGSYAGVLDGDGNSLSTRTLTITDENGRTVRAETPGLHRTTGKLSKR